MSSFKFRPRHSSAALRAALEELDKCAEDVIEGGQAAARKLEGDGNVVVDPEEYAAATESVRSTLSALDGSLAAITLSAIPMAIFIANPAIGIGAMFAQMGVNAALVARMDKKAKEVQAITKELQRLRTEAGKEALKQGKITKEDYKKNVEDVSLLQVFAGAISGLNPAIGVFGSGMFGAAIGKYTAELREKEKELEKLINEARKSTKAANEHLREMAICAGLENLDDSEQPPEDIKVNQPPAGDQVGQQESGTGEGEGVPSNNDQGTGNVAAPTPADGAATPGVAQAGDNTAGGETEAAGAGETANAEASAAQTEVDVAEAEGLQEDLQEAEKIGVAMESFHREMVQLSKAAAGLENLANIMMSTKQVGGPNPHAAMFYTAGVEAICDIMTIKPPLSLGLEAMEGADSKIEGADKQAKSGKGLVARMIEAMKAGILRFAGWIKNLWKLVTSGAQRALKRAKSMQEGIDKKQANTENITGGLANIVKDTSEFAKNVPALTPVVAQFNDANTYSSYTDLLLLASKSFKSSDAEEMLAKYEDMIKGVKDQFGKNMQAAENDGVFVLTKPWVGGKTLKITMGAHSGDVGKFNTTIGAGGEDKKVESVKPLSIQESKNVLQAIVAGLENIIKTTDENGLKGVDDKLDSAMKEYTTANPSAEDEKAGRLMKFLSGLVASRAKLPAYTINRAYVGVAASALNLISASVKDGAAEAAPAAPAQPAAPAAEPAAAAA